MIARLRRRMTLLVAVVVLAVTAGIVLSINYMNWRNIVRQAEDTLDILAENKGIRPQIKINAEGEPPEGSPQDGPEAGAEENSRDGLTDSTQGEASVSSEKPSESDDGRGPASSGHGGVPAGFHEGGPGAAPKGGPGAMREPGQPPELENAMASLSNYYVATITEDGEVENWKSDRSDLYSDEMVKDIAVEALSTGKSFGHVGTQFFRVVEETDETLLIVLDERLEIMSARHVLRTTVIIALTAGVILCIAAWFFIRMMTRPVQDAFDRQRQFVWDASHEMKTPLAVIGSNADVLQGEIGDNEYLTYIRSEVRRSADLIQNLLMLARMDQNKLTADLKDMDLGEAVLEVALPFESTAFENGKILDLQVPEGIHVNGDKAMLQQLTVILLSNALKYSDEGGRITLEVKAGRKGKEILVSNTGDGIAPKDMERIFDRFYRVDSSHNREVEGFGLGLSIAKNIADAHKGKILVSSEPGEETVFRVVLP